MKELDEFFKARRRVKGKALSMGEFKPRKGNQREIPPFSALPFLCDYLSKPRKTPKISSSPRTKAASTHRGFMCFLQLPGDHSKRCLTIFCLGQRPWQVPADALELDDHPFCSERGAGQTALGACSERWIAFPSCRIVNSLPWANT
jgi:hypothetical protein